MTELLLSILVIVVCFAIICKAGYEYVKGWLLKPYPDNLPIKRVLYFSSALSEHEGEYITSSENGYTFSFFWRKKRHFYLIKGQIEKIKTLLEGYLIPVMKFFGCYCFMLEIGVYPTSYWPKGNTRPPEGFYIPDHVGFDGVHPEDAGVNLIHHPQYWEPTNEVMRYPRITDKGMLIEESRTNLISQSW